MIRYSYRFCGRFQTDAGRPKTDSIPTRPTQDRLDRLQTDSRPTYTDQISLRQSARVFEHVQRPRRLRPTHADCRRLSQISDRLDRTETDLKPIKNRFNTDSGRLDVTWRKCSRSWVGLWSVSLCDRGFTQHCDPFSITRAMVWQSFSEFYRVVWLNTTDTQTMNTSLTTSPVFFKSTSHLKPINCKLHFI